MSGFVEIAREAFAFLESEYRFHISDFAEDNYGGYVTYINVEKEIAVKPHYEFASAFVFVFIYRLVEGQLRDNALPVTHDSQINCFDFNDVLPEDRKMKSAFDYGEDSAYFNEQNGLQTYVSEFATRLEEHGQQLLTGDFSILPLVETIIKSRADTSSLD